VEGNVVAATEQIMKFLAILIVSGIICIKLSEKLRMPDTVLFILMGVILGPEMIGLVNLKDFPIANQFVLTFGAAYILYDGGREIQLKVLNKVKVSVFLLSTLGVILSAVIIGFFAQKILGINFIYALLLGSVIASTDPSVLIPLFKNMKISPKLKQTIISESAFNDAASAIMTFAILSFLMGNSFSLANNLLELVKTASGGIIVGIVIGYLATLLVSESQHGHFSGHSGEIAVASVLGAYLVANYFGFSGFMAVFVVGIVEGNISLFNLSIEEEAYRLHVSFKEVLITILRIMIFVLLGTQVEFNLLGQYWRSAIFVVLLLVFVARPISVFLSVSFDRKAAWSFREILFLMWTRETGVIPAALAGILVSMQVPNAKVISAVTLMAIIITLSFQASTAKYVAKRLKLMQE
jgi:cell volume regulation protein A